MVRRTKRLTTDRALRILQLRYGSQIRKVEIHNSKYVADFSGDNKTFTRNDILNIEDEMYSSFGC